MSIMNKIKGKGNNAHRQDWTVDQIKLALGMKILGGSRSDIELATGHPKNSVTYLFTRKLTRPLLDENGKQVVETVTNKKGEEVEVKVRRDMTDEELFKFLGVESADDIIDYTEATLGAQAEEGEEEESEEGIDEADQAEEETEEEDVEAAS